jgi:HK97 family phage major capsid protein
MKKSILLAHAAAGLFAMPAHSNAFTGRPVMGFPQICFEAPNDQGIKAMAEEIKAEHKKAIKEACDPIKELAEKALGKAEKGEQLGETLKGDIDEGLTKMNKKVDAILVDLEQKLAKLGTGDDDDHKTAGELFTSDERVAGFLKTDPSSGKVDLRIKATLTSLTTDAAGSVGDAVQNSRIPGILPLPQRRLTVRDLLSQGRMDGSTLEYVKETGFVNNAAPVAEGATKPSSDLKFDLVTTSAKVIAHWMKASKQILSDVSQLKSIIDQRLLFGLAYVEESQLLNGDGTGQNLLGIIPQATAYAPAMSLADLTQIDIMRLAMLQAALAEYPATGHVLNPIDWTTIELTKDGEGRYIIGNPQGTATPTLWSLPVVATQAIAQSKFLTGAFKLGAQVFDRWDARIETGFVNDDFIKNLVTVLGEERLALALYRPEAFIYGDFNTALAA